MATAPTTDQELLADIGTDYRYGFAMPNVETHSTGLGISESVVREISAVKGEPEWMLAQRLKALEVFIAKKMPRFGADLSGINFADYTYYKKATNEQKRSWDDLPDEIKETYDRIGVPEAEKLWLAGVSAQYESEVVYESVQEELTKQGVVFCDMDTAVQKYPEIVQQYFGTLIPATDNKFAALNSAAWSGGSFVYVPKGVKVELPLQAYFRINSESFGQFERTLIVADEGSSIHYIEGCTAPIYRTDSLHSAVVEIFVKEGAKVRYTTVQNWSKNIYNLVTKRARAEANATMEWIDCNIGSKVTMKYPAVYLAGPGARGEVLSIAFAGSGQHQDAGAKMVHLAPNTTSRIISKSISKHGGRTSYRGLVHMSARATGSRSSVVCDALMLDGDSRSDTYPVSHIHNDSSTLEHEASAGRIESDKLYYLMSRGLTKEEAKGLIVNGFVDDVVKEIPMEYSLELNRLLALEMTDSIG
jgi:Fe-S cluster assembly protein SufB